MVGGASAQRVLTIGAQTPLSALYRHYNTTTTNNGSALRHIFDGLMETGTDAWPVPQWPRACA